MDRVETSEYNSRVPPEQVLHPVAKVGELEFSRRMSFECMIIRQYNNHVYIRIDLNRYSLRCHT